MMRSMFGSFFAGEYAKGNDGVLVVVIDWGWVSILRIIYLLITHVPSTRHPEAAADQKPLAFDSPHEEYPTTTSRHLQHQFR